MGWMGGHRVSGGIRCLAIPSIGPHLPERLAGQSLTGLTLLDCFRRRLIQQECAGRGALDEVGSVQ
jgi:hypothetical protein